MALVDARPQSRSQQGQQWSASVRELAEDMPDPQEDDLVDVSEGASLIVPGPPCK